MNVPVVEKVVDTVAVIVVGTIEVETVVAVT